MLSYHVFRSSARGFSDRFHFHGAASVLLVWDEERVISLSSPLTTRNISNSTIFNNMFQIILCVKSVVEEARSLKSKPLPLAQRKESSGAAPSTGVPLLWPRDGQRLCRSLGFRKCPEGPKVVNVAHVNGCEIAKRNLLLLI